MCLTVYDDNQVSRKEGSKQRGRAIESVECNRIRYNTAMIFDRVDKWPDALRHYLDLRREQLLAFANRRKEQTRWSIQNPGKHFGYPYGNINQTVWDQALHDLPILLQDTHIRGWHCTRLTDGEISDVEANGLRLQNLTSLTTRINQLYADGIVDKATAQLLIEKNDANATNRKQMIWFCFFRPRRVRQSFVERFFRSWGGEALYNDHEGTKSLAGSVIANIGTPCVVVAKVRAGDLNHPSFLPNHLVNRYLRNGGFRISLQECRHEGYTRCAIPASSIVRIVRYDRDRPAFGRLTGCEQWDPGLT